MDLTEINNEIERLENGNTSYNECYKLAMLYIVRDGLECKRSDVGSGYSYASAPAFGEFGQAFNSAPYEPALQVLEEHFEAIKILYPKEFDLVLKKLKNL